MQVSGSSWSLALFLVRIVRIPLVAFTVLCITDARTEERCGWEVGTHLRRPQLQVPDPVPYQVPAP